MLELGNKGKAEKTSGIRDKEGDASEVAVEKRIDGLLGVGSRRRGWLRDGGHNFMSESDVVPIGISI